MSVSKERRKGSLNLSHFRITELNVHIKNPTKILDQMGTEIEIPWTGNFTDTGEKF